MAEAQSKLSLEDLDHEVQKGRTLLSQNVREYLHTIELLSESYLSQVLIALWDNGFYEYVVRHDRVNVQECCQELGYEPLVFQSLVDYLVGRGLFKPVDGALVLSEKGQPYWNYVTRGVLTAHLGGYNQLLTHLAPLLRKEIPLSQPLLRRDGRLIALGSNHMLLGSGTVPWVLRIIKDLGGKYVMDIGCGAGMFLIYLARKWPHGGGIGIDMDGPSIVEANQNAIDYGVSDRVIFRQAKLSPEPMDVSPEIMAKVDVLTAMYVFHEFGGNGGPDAISKIIGWVKRQFPGRKLLLTEVSRADPVAFCENPPQTFAQLDVSFFHPLSRQGPLRTPDEWKKIIENAGARLIERVPGFGTIPAWISLYVIGLD